MMTEAIQDSDRPWLEYFPEGSSTVQRVPLEKETFTLGRAETVDLQVDSTRVSREHARIVLQNGTYYLHDLDSTNGTDVNGQSIDRIELADGDVISVADTEITFLTRSTSQLRNMATQPLELAADETSSKEETRSEPQKAYDAILRVREVHEAILQQLAPIELKTIVELPDIVPFASLVEPAACDMPPDERNSTYLQPPTHLLIRQRETRRWTAVEQAVTTTDRKRLVASLDPWEIQANDELLWHFAALREYLPGTDSLWAAVKANNVVDLPDVAAFCRELQQLDIEIACHGFVGSESQVRELEELDPELLFLAPELTNDIIDNSRYQERLLSIQKACTQLHIRPIIHDVPDSETMRICLDLGFRFFVQEHTQPLPALSEALLQQAETEAEMLSAV
jgi:EAL domain-containing protein (putative c-di-GMP-specific phosphodiesterase class I)